MVGFLRKKKSDKVLLGEDTVLDRKGRVDGTSLLDDNGDPTQGTLYHQNRLAQKNGGRKDEENNAPAPPQYPPQNYPYGQTYPPQNGYGYPQQQQQQPPPAQQYPPMNSGFGNSYGNNQATNNTGAFGRSSYGNAGYSSNSYGNNSYGAPAQGGQQYPVQYGQQPGQQQQYPQQYGNYPPPYPPQPEAQKKSSFFRIPGYGKK